jgi:hypothetical protein
LRRSARANALITFAILDIRTSFQRARSLKDKGMGSRTRAVVMLLRRSQVERGRR